MMPQPLNLSWSRGNTKLKKLQTVSFNLPAFRSKDGFHVCPKAGFCATVCYARQGRYVMPNVAATREANLVKARGPVFPSLAIQDLKRIRATVIRLHDSGDFFDQAYLDAWLEVMRAFPEKSFYAYTKSLHLDFSQRPSNFQVIQSMGGMLDDSIDTSKPHARIFVSHRQRRRAGYVDGNVNDGPAIRGEQKIGLVHHGTRKLKPGQILYLNVS